MKVPKRAHRHSHLCTHKAKISWEDVSPTMLQSGKALQRPCSSNPQTCRGLAAHTSSSYESSTFLVKNQKFESHMKTVPSATPTLTQGRVGQEPQQTVPGSLTVSAHSTGKGLWWLTAGLEASQSEMTLIRT